jgi:hypothetical protein
MCIADVASTHNHNSNISCCQSSKMLIQPLSKPTPSVKQLQQQPTACKRHSYSPFNAARPQITCRLTKAFFVFEIPVCYTQMYCHLHPKEQYGLPCTDIHRAHNMCIIYIYIYIVHPMSPKLDNRCRNYEHKLIYTYQQSATVTNKLMLAQQIFIRNS